MKKHYSSLLPVFICVLSIVASLTRAPAAAPLDVWQWLNPLPTGNPLSGVWFLNGQFVTVGAASSVLSSSDGANWVTHYVPSGEKLAEIAFGNGVYVVVGSDPGNGVILTSTNLDDWALQPSGTTNALNSIAYGNGRFAVAGNGGALLSSSDGSNWVAHASGTTDSLGPIVYGSGVFVALSGASPQPAAYASPDAASWTRQSIVTDLSAPNNFLVALNYANGLFLAGGYIYRSYPNYDYRPLLFSCTDGANWSPVPVPVAGVNGISSLFAAPGRYYALDGTFTFTNSLLVSSDGTNFSRLAAANFIATNSGVYYPFGGPVGGVSPHGFAYGNGSFVNAGTVIQTSLDATNWTTITRVPTPALSDIAYGNGITVAVGGTSILSSSNGLPFTSQAAPVTRSLTRVLFANGLFHCLGYDGTLILRSTNGVQWVKRNSGGSSSLLGLAYRNQKWVAVGRDGMVSTSPDGQAWTLRFSGTTYTLNSVTYGGGMFVAVGDYGEVITSPDATDWAVQFSDSPAALFDVAYGNGQFVAVGAGGTIVTSPDGANWAAGNSGTSADLRSIAFGNGQFLVGDAMLSSTNGLAWTLHRPAAGNTINGTRFLNGSFYLVGDNGTIVQDAAAGLVLLSGAWNSAQGRFQIHINGGLGQSFRLQSCDALGAAWFDRAQFATAPQHGYSLIPPPLRSRSDSIGLCRGSEAAFRPA